MERYPSMYPSRSRRRTRRRQGEAESPTRLASSRLLNRPSACSAVRIRASMASSSTFGITDYFWRQDNSVIANSWAIAVHFARTLPGLLRHKCRSKERHNVQPIGDVEPQPGDPAVFRLDVRQRYHALWPGLSADRAATRVSRRRDGDAAGANLQGTSDRKSVV